jgi:hypothetical protein
VAGDPRLLLLPVLDHVARLAPIADPNLRPVPADRLDALQERRPESRAPTVEEILGLSQDVSARIKDDPIAGRELLRHMLLDGKVTLTPNEDGSYTAGSMLLWARVAWRTRKPRGGSGPSGASGDPDEVVGIDGCAGPQHDFPDHQNQGVAEVWVPFEESIAIGW